MANPNQKVNQNPEGINPGDKLYKKEYEVGGDYFDIYTTPEGWTKIYYYPNDGWSGSYGEGTTSVLKMPPAQAIKLGLISGGISFSSKTFPYKPGQTLGYHVVPKYSDDYDTIQSWDTIPISVRQQDAGRVVVETPYPHKNGGIINYLDYAN